MKIVACRSLGLRQTYSPEMASVGHNYQTAHSCAVHRNSHAVSYCLVALKCLWLKAHFAPEFWAAVMSDCHPDKLVRYMGVARSESWEPTDITNCGRQSAGTNRTRGVEFGAVNIENLTIDFTVNGNTVNQGLIGIKGLGEKAAKVFAGRGQYESVDQFVASGDGRRAKGVLERFIKLGAFRHLPGHENAYALWRWYEYAYCNSGKTSLDGGQTKISMAKFRQHIREQLLISQGWDHKRIEQARADKIKRWRVEYPKRQKVPNALKNWKPEPVVDRQSVMSLFPDDFTIQERLEFQKRFLGYLIDSPLDGYIVTGCNIGEAKEAGKDDCEAKLDVIIVSSDAECLPRKTKTGKDFRKLVVSDGIQQAIVFIWSNELRLSNPALFKHNMAITMFVDYDEARNSFAVVRNEPVMKLPKK